MRWWLIRGAAGLVLFSLACIIVAMTLAWLPAAEGLRRRMVEEGLSRHWGEPVAIGGKVQVELWPRLTLTVEDVTSTTDGVSPVKVGLVRLMFARWVRLPVRPLLFAVAVEDGRLEFPLRPSDDAAPGTLLSSPVAFFSVLPRLRLKNVVFDLADAADNWRFTLEVGQVETRLRDGVEHINASAKLNGFPVNLFFQFDREPHPPEPGLPPYGAALSIQARGLTADVKTRSWRAAFDDNLTLALTASSSSIGDLLEIAGIARTVDGRGTLWASLLTDPRRISARGIALDLDFTSGIRTSFTGSVADLMGLRGIDLVTVTDLKPSSKPATSLLDITVTRLSGRFHDGANGLMLTDAVLATNAFSQSLKDVGPISIASIKRGDDGRVALVGISIQGSPDPDPLFHLTGDVLDTLGMRDMALAGDFNLPVEDLLDVPASAQGKLGRLVGSATITDQGGPARFETFSAELRESALISAALKLRDASPDKPDESVMQADLSVPKLAPLAAALGTSTAFSGGLAFSGTFERTGPTVRSRGALDLGRTHVDGALTTTVENGRPRIAGALTSPVIYTQDLASLLYDDGAAPKAPRIAIAGVRMRTDHPLDLSHAVDLDVEVKADRIDGIGPRAENLNASLKLDDGRFVADPVSVTIGKGRLRATLSEADGDRMRIKGTGEGWPLQEIAGSSSRLIRSGTLNATFDVTTSLTSGTNPAATVDGTVTAGIEDGVLNSGMLDFAGLGLLGSLFNPAVLSGESRLRCARIPLRFSGGVGQTDPAIIVETEHVRAVGRGTLNLARETVDMDFTPRPIDGGGNGYSFTVKGPFAKPQIALGGKTEAGTSGGCR